MTTDGRRIPRDEVMRADFCVVGAGPAGMTVAAEIARQGFSVLLLERGADLGDGPATLSNTAKNVGIPYRLSASHLFGVGGSTDRWHLTTPLGDGFGRLRELDEADFESRSWVANSGWPLKKDDLIPFYAAARSLFGYPWSSGIPQHVERSDQQVDPFFDPDGDVQARTFWFADPKQLIGTLRRDLEDSGRVRLLSHAAVSDIRCEGLSGAVTSLTVKTSSTHSFSVQANNYVLAGGGIENPRLLLASRSRHPQGIGNSNDLVGRFFMEHPHFPSGYLIPSDPNLFVDKSSHDVFLQDGLVIQKEYGLSEDQVEKHQLNRSVFRMDPAPVSEKSMAVGLGEPASVSIEAANRLHRAIRARRWSSRSRDDLAIAARGAPHIGRYLAQRARSLAAKRLGLARYTQPHLFWILGMAEQVPNALSRVTISARRDPLGVPLGRLDWRLTEQDMTSMEKTQQLFEQALLKAGHSAVESYVEGRKRPPYLGGGNHHMGTTRMADTSRRGVVDRNGRVYGVENLFIAGSSVFPTGGYANPTLTILALALRLADYLVRMNGQSVDIESPPAAPAN